MTTLAVAIMDWPQAINAARAIREQVFVLEQQVPVALEWDEFDVVSRHALASQDGQYMATGRLLPNGHIGRMAVLAEFRGNGVGAEVLLSLMNEAKTRNLKQVVLHAQIHAAEFYRRYGFKAKGQAFMEAGIMHVLMQADVA